MTDWSKIIPRVLNGDRMAVTELIENAQDPIFTFCFHLTKNRQLAEDLSHDAMLKSLSSLAQLENHAVYLAWLKKIARSLFLDYLKSAQNSKTHLQFEDLEETDLQEDPSISVEQIHAMRTLQALPEADRALLILVDLQEHSYEDIASILGVPVGTVKSKLSRAREKFSSIFNGTNQESDSSSLRARRRDGSR